MEELRELYKKLYSIRGRGEQPLTANQLAAYIKQILDNADKEQEDLDRELSNIDAPEQL